MGRPVQPRIAVVGSVNMDVVNRVQTFPRPGETVRALNTAYHAGGKGANQAVAAAAGGGEVAMIGAVGTDAFAVTLREALRSAGVEVEALERKESTSGQATITVDAAGQNTIVLSPGANAMLTPNDVGRHAATIVEAQALLVQNEIPWETTLAAMRLAHDHGVPVICNPAPVRRLSDEVYGLVDSLVANELEAGTLVGRTLDTVAEAAQAARELAALGPRRVLITLGDRGAVLYDGREGRSIIAPAFPVEVVDTTGAGDTFIGFYAVASLTLSGEQALRRSQAAAALAITRPGAQEAVPSAGEVEAFLAARGEA